MPRHKAPARDPLAQEGRPRIATRALQWLARLPPPPCLPLRHGCLSISRCKAECLGAPPQPTAGTRGTPAQICRHGQCASVDYKHLMLDAALLQAFGWEGRTDRQLWTGLQVTQASPVRKAHKAGARLTCLGAGARLPGFSEHFSACWLVSCLRNLAQQSLCTSVLPTSLMGSDYAIFYNKSVFKISVGVLQA